MQTYDTIQCGGNVIHIHTEDADSHSEDLNTDNIIWVKFTCVCVLVIGNSRSRGQGAKLREKRGPQSST